MATTCEQRIDHARRLDDAHRELEGRLSAGVNETMDAPDPCFACVQRAMVELLLDGAPGEEPPAGEEASAIPPSEADAIRDLEELLQIGVNASIGAPDPILTFVQRAQTEVLRCRAGLRQQLGRAKAGGEAGAKSLDRVDAIVQTACNAFAPLARLALGLTLTPAIGALAEVFEADADLASEQCAAAVAMLFNGLWGRVCNELMAAKKDAQLQSRVGEAALHEIKLVNKVTTRTTTE